MGFSLETDILDTVHLVVVSGTAVFLDLRCDLELAGVRFDSVDALKKQAYNQKVDGQIPDQQEESIPLASPPLRCTVTQIRL